MKLLAVDDEPLNLDILEAYLNEEGLNVIKANNGKEGWSTLEQHSDEISVVLLDWLMPEMDGMEFLQKMKANSAYKRIPVIMQTGETSSESIIQGIEAGVYYYLTKPYTQETLLSIVRAAISDALKTRKILDGVREQQETQFKTKEAHFEFKTVEEAQKLACVIAHNFMDPERVVIGLSEIMCNAVEHGNLEIGYSDKGRLMLEGKFTSELHRRLQDDRYKNKVVHVELKQDGEWVNVTIEDEGNGFSWKDYIDFDPSRATDPNGRGIIIANTMSFDALEYLGKGNKVVCKVKNE